MKALKVLLFLVIVAVFASTATAATVTITGGGINCTGTLTLGSMNVDATGNVSLSVSGTCSGGTCTPSSASVSPTTIARSITLGGTAASQSVTISNNCGTSLGYSATVTSGSNFISVPSSGTGSMTVTFNTSALAAGSYNGSISVIPAGYGAQTISVSITVSTGGGGSGTDMTITGHQPSYLTNQSVAALGAANYYAIMPQTYSKVTVYLESQDWDATDMDLIISNVRQPACSEIVRGGWSAGTNGVWYASSIGRSNETVFIRTTIPAGTTIYATVCNFTSGLSGKFRLSWGGE